MNRYLARAFGLISIAAMGLLVLSGCTTPEGEGFAIYLTKEDVPPEKMEMLSNVDLADQPVISMQDIIQYNAQTHEIKLTDAAFERISQLEVPVRGKSFLVCVDKAPIYWGAFWAGYSSQSFDGITIMLKPPFPGKNFITISRGYPSADFAQGEDPRANAVIMDSLEKAGKLK